jgi:hypothetical protein
MLSAKLNSVFAASFALVAACGLAACGGDNKEPPKTPDTEIPSTPDAGADMPAPPSTESSEATPPPSTTPSETASETPAAPAGLAMPESTVKVSLKGKKTAKLEIKSDGSVSNGGKASAKITSNEVQDASGKTLATVSGDAIKTASGADWASFQGDDLVLAKGDKLSLADDGVLTWTAGGKGTPAGKADGVGAAKKATLIAAAWVISPPPAEKAAKTAPKTTSPKPAEKKAAGTAKKK